MSLKVFVVPFFTLLITVPLIFLVVGPIANTFSDGLTSLFQAIWTLVRLSLVLYLVSYGKSWLCSECTGRLFPLLSLMWQQTEVLRFFQQLSFHVSRKQGVLGAIMLKTKKKKSVSFLCQPYFIYFWGDRPAIYGVTLPMKTPFYISCGVSGLMGLPWWS